MLLFCSGYSLGPRCPLLRVSIELCFPDPSVSCGDASSVDADFRARFEAGSVEAQMGWSASRSRFLIPVWTTSWRWSFSKRALLRSGWRRTDTVEPWFGAARACAMSFGAAKCGRPRAMVAVDEAEVQSHTSGSSRMRKAMLRLPQPGQRRSTRSPRDARLQVMQAFYCYYSPTSNRYISTNYKSTNSTL